MPVRPSPTVRGRRLRSALRDLRRERGYTADQVAALSNGDWTAATITRWETGDRRVRPVDLRALLDIYDIHGDEREVLIALAGAARQRGWWQLFSDAVPGWFKLYLGLETEATSLLGYDAELVPGLLQTEAYYRAFMQTAPAAGDEAAIRRKLELRAARQERLAGDDAPKFWVVINEAVIRRVVGDADVMRAQLEHIVQMAERPQITVQVLPFKAGAHPAMDGSFMIVGFSDPRDPDVAYVENQMGSLLVEALPEVERYRAMFTQLIALALGPEESRVMISEVAATPA
jgi:transcriptional regulator with XRE-family HTH domain